KAALDEANEQHPRDQAEQGQSPDELANVQAHGWLDLVESHLLDFLLKYACTSWATRAHRRLPALSVRQLLSSLSAVSTHSATGPPGKYRMPASVLALLTDPVLCATTTLGGRKRVNLSLSSHFLRCSSISLHASGLTALPRWTFSSRRIISLAVVEPRPNFLDRSGATEVVLPRKTLALIRVCSKPQACMRWLVASMPIRSSTRFVAVLSE